MNQVKKFASLLLALTLLLAMAVPAMAAGEGSITLDNPQKDQTYTAYKIFDVRYDTEKTTYAYTIDGNSEWFATVNDYNGLTLTLAPGTKNTYVVTKNDNFSAGTFANTLKAAASGKTGTTLQPKDGVVQATGLELGYYFVASSTGALCNLTTTDPHVIIHDKNDVPFDKVDDKESVEVGETVTYTITGKVPDTTGFDTYTYEINDVMSDGLTFNKDIAVKIENGSADVALTETQDYTVEYDVADSDKPNGNPNRFKLTIKVKDLQQYVTKGIEVTYTATVNADAVSKIERNKATLTYSNNPTTDEKSTTPEDEETVYSAKIVIDKYKAGDKNEKLSGAKFVLYKKATDDSKLYYQYVEPTSTEKARVEWVSNRADATVKTTDTHGSADFVGLKDGNYFLEETEAPAGYNLLTAPVEVTIDGQNANETNPAALTVAQEVENQSGTELPSTGGIGTTIFYAAGGILVLAAVVLLITKRRMNAEKE